MTTTDKLAAALKTALERLDAVGACEDADVALFAQTRTALAEYEAERDAASDPDRPLSVGDRVRVVAPHDLTGFYPSFGLGAELVVVRNGTGSLLKCAAEGSEDYALNFAPYELQRIPTTQPEKQT